MIRTCAYFFSGIDKSLLDKCGDEDKSIYLYLGILLMIICVLSFFAGAYALESLIIPRDEKGVFNLSIDYLELFALSLLWVFTVFNFYRLIISSTGIGDMSRRITFGEIAQNVPKFFICIAFALVTIVSTLNWILALEINDSLSNLELKQIDSFTHHIEAENHSVLLDLYLQRESLKKDLDVQVSLQEDKKKLLEEYKAEAGDVLEKSALIIDRLNQQINEVNDKIASTRHEMQKKKDKYVQETLGKNSLFKDLERVLETHFPIFIFSTFLIILIYLSPIFIRLSWTRGVYEYSEKYQEDISMRKYGVAKEYRQFKNDFVAWFAVPELIKSINHEKFVAFKKNFVLRRQNKNKDKN